MSYEPFNKLVKLAARAFYDDYTTKGDNQPKSGRSDNRGIAVVVLDALTRRQWVREEDLAKDLKLHSKQLRRIIRFFEEEKLITRESRKETAKGAKVFSAAVAATHDGIKKEGDDKLKFHTHSYCCLDYSQIYDVVRYRLHRLKKKLKDELDNRNTVQEYVCPNCNRRYTALDALRLISMEDEFFHCEKCDGELVAESDKLAAEEPGDGDDNRKRRREKLKDMLQKMEEQLKPLMEQLNRVKDLTIPEFGNLLAWEHRANAAARGGGDAGANGGNRSGQGGTPMPFTGDTKVEVDFGDLKEDVKPETGTSGLKVLPPWMIKQGMNLTKEQRGEVNEEDGAPSSMDDKKSAVETDDKKNIQDEYLKAYYAALLQKQQEAEAAQRQQEMDVKPAIDTGPSSSRQVGMKVKREDDGEEDVDWEESNAADTNESFKLNDLNVEAKEEEASPEDDDDIDWEED